MRWVCSTSGCSTSLLAREKANHTPLLADKWLCRGPWNGREGTSAMPAPSCECQRLLSFLKMARED